MAKKTKKPNIKTPKKTSTASKAVKTQKPVKNTKVAKAQPKAKVVAKPQAKTQVRQQPKVAVNTDKMSPKVVEKTKKTAALEVTKKSDKKNKRDEDLGFDDYNDDYDFEEAAHFDSFKNKTQEELEEIRTLLGEGDGGDEVEIALRDAEGRLYCRMRECDELSSVDGYCRYHYLKLWKKIQLRKKILTDGKLEKYIEELTQRYPDKYIEMIRDDLKSEKGFLAAIQELEIEDVNTDDNESDDDQTLLEEVRGMQTAGESDDDSF